VEEVKPVLSFAGKLCGEAFEVLRSLIDLEVCRVESSSFYTVLRYSGLITVENKMSKIGSTDNIKIERFPILTKDNYREWLDLVEDVLTSKGLWKYAIGSVEELEDSSGKEDYLKNDAKAVAFLK